MKIGTLFVKRPVMTSMVFLGIALFGLLAWLRLPQELFPNVSVPQLVVITKYPNAAPAEIENLITKPVEEAVGTVPNLKRVSSISKEGLSAVTLNFAWGTDMGFAHLSTREKLDRMKDRLPPEAEEPIIKQVNPFAYPVMIISVTGNMELADMTELCDEVIKTKLEKTDGVGSVTISGGQKREILVEVDRGRLSASSISLPMVVEALKNANYDYPAGTTQGKTFEYLVRTQGRFETIDDIGQTIVQVENPESDPMAKYRDQKRGSTVPREQRMIPLSHMAEIRQSLQDKTSYSRFNGKDNISISIQKQADANTVDLSKAVKVALAELKPSLPQGVDTVIIYDEANYIQAALGNMRNNVLIGGILAFLVLFYFLGNFRDAVNMGLAIPVSVLASLILMYMTGQSLNMLTLAGLALAVGNLTDCATVVTENIVRHHKKLGKPLMQAAVDGADEMVSSMVSATMTNIAVFLPLLFITGIAQQLFQGLFLVTVFANLAGLFVSLTLIPRMAAHKWTVPKFLREERFVKFTLNEPQQATMNQRFENLLRYVLDRPRALMKGIGMLLLLAVAALILTPIIFMPRMDQGQFIIQLSMPIGTRLDVTNLVAAKLETALSNINGIDVMVNVGSAEEEEELDALESHEAHLVVTRRPKTRLSTDQIIERFKRMVKDENLEGGNLTYVLQDSPLRAALAGAAPVEVEVKGSDLTYLTYVSNELMKKFREAPYLYSIQTTFALPSKETQVLPDKDRAASFQLSVADIAKTALIAIKGMVATTFKKDGKEIDIRVRLRQQDREDSFGIRQLTVRSPRGQTVPLDAVAQISPGLGASEIRHLDQQRALIVSAEVTGGGTSKALAKVQKIIAPYRTKDVTVELGGESRRQAESYSGLKYTFILALLLVYMIMAAEFESLTQPLIIMTTVPFSVIGVALTLFITNTPFSSVVVLGIVILAGIVVNNGIVLIDHINGLRAEGYDLKKAVVEGSSNRLRPILLTTITTILAVLPLALGIGKGDELAQPLAVVTFGGMFISTMLTLLVIPLLYVQLAQWQGTRKAL